MPGATVTSKGQITIPIQVRIALGLDPGDRVEFVETGKGQFAMLAASIPVQNLKGFIHRPAKPISIDEMNVAIAKRAAQLDSHKRKK
ncbi:MAG TPA: AbrB/MazE/SpoVT family DNA-binding domain-containing protein [Terriglobales bacterium]|nr:AbrB/MazE/SpoVT family DNA-binding domain-containing protein [Terriglobales bacterium]